MNYLAFLIVMLGAVASTTLFLRTGRVKTLREIDAAHRSLVIQAHQDRVAPLPKPSIAELEHEVLSPEFLAWATEMGELKHGHDCRVCNAKYRPLLHQPKPKPKARWLACEAHVYSFSSTACMFCGEVRDEWDDEEFVDPRDSGDPDGWDEYLDL